MFEGIPELIKGVCSACSLMPHNTSLQPMAQNFIGSTFIYERRHPTVTQQTTIRWGEDVRIEEKREGANAHRGWEGASSSGKRIGGSWRLFNSGAIYCGYPSVSLFLAGFKWTQ
jgi:hypothetical protein